MHKYGESKRLELWWQLYVTPLPERDIQNFKLLIFAEECTTVSMSAINWNCYNHHQHSQRYKEAVVFLALTVNTAWVEEDNRPHPYGLSQAVSLISSQTMTNEVQKCAVHRAGAKGYRMFVCNATHPFLKIPPFSHSTYSILVHLPTNGDNPFSKSSRLFVSFLKWENWHIQNTWVLYRINLE